MDKKQSEYGYDEYEQHLQLQYSTKALCNNASEAAKI